MRYIILATVLLLSIGGYIHSQQVNRVCAGVQNVALCDLTLQAGGSEAKARAYGNGEEF